MSNMCPLSPPLQVLDLKVAVEVTAVDELSLGAGEEAEARRPASHRQQPRKFSFAAQVDSNESGLIDVSMRMVQPLADLFRRELSNIPELY